MFDDKNVKFLGVIEETAYEKADDVLGRWMTYMNEKEKWRSIKGTEMK